MMMVVVLHTHTHILSFFDSCSLIIRHFFFIADGDDDKKARVRKFRFSEIFARMRVYDYVMLFGKVAYECSLSLLFLMSSYTHTHTHT